MSRRDSLSHYHKLASTLQPGILQLFLSRCSNLLCVILIDTYTNLFRASRIFADMILRGSVDDTHKCIHTVRERQRKRERESVCVFVSVHVYLFVGEGESLCVRTRICSLCVCTYMYLLPSRWILRSMVFFGRACGSATHTCAHLICAMIRVGTQTQITSTIGHSWFRGRAYAQYSRTRARTRTYDAVYIFSLSLSLEHTHTVGSQIRENPPTCVFSEHEQCPTHTYR